MVQAPQPQPKASFGAQLLRARTERGISPEDVARETRVPKRYLLALENESIGTLPGGLYNRAYLRMYAVYVGLDADSLLQDYDRSVQEQTDSRSLAAQPDQITALQTGIKQRESQSVGGKAAARISKGRMVASITAVLMLAGGVWVGARHFTRPAPVPPAPVSPAAVRVSDTLPKTARTNESTPPPQPPAEPERQTPDVQTEPPRSAATSVAAITEPGTEKRAQVPRSEETPVPASMSVNDSGVGTDIVNRELVGRAETFAVGARVVFWTQVAGGRAGSTIRHVWLHEGRPVATVALPVRSASWRTQSQRLLAPGAEGEWRVEARDGDGGVLAQAGFRVAAH